MRSCLLLFCIPALLSAQAPRTSRGQVESAGDMLGFCRPIADASTRGDYVSLAPTLDTQYCWGAFAALQRSTAVVSGAKRVLNVCTPEESRRTQLVAVFVEYVGRHPERRHEDWFVVALDALSAAFPC